MDPIIHDPLVEKLNVIWHPEHPAAALVPVNRSGDHVVFPRSRLRGVESHLKMGGAVLKCGHGGRQFGGPLGDVDLQLIAGTAQLMLRFLGLCDVPHHPEKLPARISVNPPRRGNPPLAIDRAVFNRK